jgi:hypothetical protein
VRKAYKILVGNSEGKRPRETLRHGWEGNIEMVIKEIEVMCVRWIKRAWNTIQWRAVVVTVMNIPFIKRKEVSSSTKLTSLFGVT